MRRTRTTITAAAAAAVLSVSACAGTAGGGGGGGDDGPITLGTSLSLTGPLGSFGVLQRQGYQQAVDDVNADGGLDVGGTRREVTLKVLDNRSDPNLASSQARELILKDGATALLGACTPPVIVPMAQVADSQKVPLVTSCAPVNAFRGSNDAGWEYSWDLFFDEQDQADGVAQVVGQVPTNKKVALFTDTEPDGVVERPIYIASLQAQGMEVVGDYTFPPGTSDFSSFVNDAKAKGAEVVVAQMVPPDGIALWKQMKGLGFAPRAAFVAKAAATKAWSDALGPLAEGTLGETFWAPSVGDPETAQHIEDTLGKAIPDASDLTFAVFSFTAAQVLLDGVSAAGSTDPGEINTAIGETDGEYALGTIAFEDNTATTPLLIAQWQGGSTVIVDPPQEGVTLQAPPAGLG